ncbi:hypothetical protein [Amycolatopsis suaedae]|uniref:Phage tail tape measure protein n=1 Tax=Amycolatopsis suaedae TaxID=2510978 RepID=A0A4Q7IY02_9PSEU|nr:hypothetical protein [Amycolatopsis suaedae]RZQ59840.1 hypothetical protein EWH70_32520 [Amycolatopsis suaedae]
MANDLIFTVLGIDKASRVFDKVGDSMNRMGTRATAILAGVAGSSAAAGAAVAASVAAVPAAFIGLGAVAVRENAQVQQSFQQLGNELKHGLAADAAPMADALVGAADQIGAAYAGLRPQMQQAFAASAGYVDDLVGTVTDFATQAMPGLVTATARAGPVFAGLRTFARDAGVGVSEFFEITSSKSAEAGKSLEHFGLLVRDSLPAVGTILANLTGLWAEHGDEAVSVITGLLDVLGDLSGSALPVVSAGLGVALDVLSGVLAVVQPLTGALGPLIGVWLALSTAMRGVTAVKGIMDNVTGAVTNFGNATNKAAGAGGVGKLAAATGGVMSMLGGPWGIAIGAAAVLLASFGRDSQQAAADQRSLADALRESGGAFDDNARKQIYNSEAYQEVAGLVDKLGISHGEMIDALVKGGPALDQFRARLDEIARLDAVEATGEMSEVGHAAFDLSGKLDGLRGGVTGAVAEFERMAQATRPSEAALAAVGFESRVANEGVRALNDAFQVIADSAATVEERGKAIIAVLDQLAGRTPSYEEATQAINDGIRELGEGFDKTTAAAGKLGDSMLTANGTINTTTANGSALQNKLVELQSGFANAGAAVTELIQRNVPLGEAVQRVNADLETQRQRFIDGAVAMGFSRDGAIRMADAYGIGTQSLGVWLSRMSEAELAANGVTVSVDNVGNAVYRLPNGKAITVSVNDLATGPLSRIRNYANRLGNQVITVAAQINARFNFADGGLVPGFADGGPVRRFPMGGRVYGPGGPREDKVRAMLSNGEFVVNAAQTAKNLPLLRAINNGADFAGAFGFQAGSGGGGAGGTSRLVIDVTGADEEFKRLIRKMVRVDGGGSVEAAFGRG